MKKPKIFRVSRALGHNSPINSWAINAGTVSERSVGCCESCLKRPHIKYDLLIQGFDDFRDIDFSKKGFIGSSCPLISLPENIARAVEILTGVSSTKVGYAEWNQEMTLPKEKWFNTEPYLAALFVDAVLDEIVDYNKQPFEKCEECGRNRVSFIINKTQFVFPVYESWKGQDMFILAPFSQFNGTIITETGVEKLKKLGMMDLVLEELEWA